MSEKNKRVRVVRDAEILSKANKGILQIAKGL